MAIVGTPLMAIETGSESEHDSGSIENEEKPPSTPAITSDPEVHNPIHGKRTTPAEQVLATPAVRRISRENNIDLSMVFIC